MEKVIRLQIAKIQSEGVALLVFNFSPISAWFYLQKCCLSKSVYFGTYFQRSKYQKMVVLPKVMKFY